MKKAAFVLLWFLMVQSSQKADWYIEIPVDDDVTIRVPRDLYLEHQEFMEFNDINITKRDDIESYAQWELFDKYPEARQREAKAWGRN